MIVKQDEKDNFVPQKNKKNNSTPFVKNIRMRPEEAKFNLGKLLLRLFFFLKPKHISLFLLLNKLKLYLYTVTTGMQHLYL